MSRGPRKTVLGPVVNGSTNKVEKTDFVESENTSASELNNDSSVEVKTTAEIDSDENKKSKSELLNVKNFVVINKEKANCKIIAASGKVIEFDNEGKATVELIDALHLKQFDCYEIKEK